MSQTRHLPFIYFFIIICFHPRKKGLLAILVPRFPTGRAAATQSSVFIMSEARAARHIDDRSLVAYLAACCRYCCGRPSLSPFWIQCETASPQDAQKHKRRRRMAPPQPPRDFIFLRFVKRWPSLSAPETDGMRGGEEKKGRRRKRGGRRRN